MLGYLLRQPRNAWQELGLLQKIEIVLLGAILLVFFFGRLYALYAQGLNNVGLDPLLLVDYLVQGFILLIFINGPFILLYLGPRQDYLIFLRSQVLSKSQFFQLCAYLYCKYQMIILILFIVAILPFFVLAPWYGLLALLLFVLNYLLVFLIQTATLALRRSNGQFLIINFLLLGGYVIIMIINDYVLFAPFLYTTLYWLLTGARAASLFKDKDRIHPELILPLKPGWDKPSLSVSRDFASIPKLLPAKIQVLFNKEALGLWRNPSYRRLKMITLVVFLLLLFMIQLSSLPDRHMWMAFLAAAAIWIHYSHYFSEKYVQAEPLWFMKTLPFRFYQLWTSKFLAEFLFIIILLLCFWIFLLASGLNATGQLHLLGLFILFATIVLVIVLNFQILFFDDPRWSGLAYHVTIVFIVFLSISDFLVGPLISLILLVFFYYRTYRSFKT